MSKIQWEYDLVEKPFCEQLRLMGWQWFEGDTDVPELTERETFREVLLKGRLTAALRKLNLRDGQPWLDETRITRAIRDLEQATGHRLIEVNQAATELLLKGTVVDGLPEWDYGRPQPVKFIHFENPANNDFLVINQFKVELTSGRGHVIPDAVLFVNGIPLVVAEFKSPAFKTRCKRASISSYVTRTSAKSCFPRSTPRTKVWSDSSTPISFSLPAIFLRRVRQPSVRHLRRIWNGRIPVQCP